MAVAGGRGQDQAGAGEWWARQRYRYNRGLAAAGLVAAALSAAILRWATSMEGRPGPRLSGWIALAIGAAIGYGLMMAAANLCYLLGPFSERVLRPRHPDRYRRVTFRLGFWFSLALPFLAPLLLGCLGLVGALVGDGRPVAEAELDGTYIADYGFATDALTLTQDGRFTQEVTLKSTRKKAVSHGTWRYDAARRDLYLFGGFLVVVDYEGKLLPGFDQPKPNTMGVLRVRHTAWAMELGGGSIPWRREGIDIPHTKQMRKAAERQ